MAAIPPVFWTVMASIVTVRVRLMAVVDAVSTAVGSLMVIEIWVADDPPVLFAQIVKMVVLMFTVGVPDMDPDVRLKERPVGSTGLIAHCSTIPPLVLIVTSVILMPRVSTLFVEDTLSEDAGSLMVIETVFEALPPVLLAYTV